MCCESSPLPVDPANNPNQAVIDKLQVNINERSNELEFTFQLGNG